MYPEQRQKQYASQLALVRIVTLILFLLGTLILLGLCFVDI